MTNFFIDAEFHEDGETIEMISLAIVSGRDDGTYPNGRGGHYLYIENPGFVWEDVPAGHWIQENVRPHIGGDLYAVLAVWDLTEIERTVLAGRFR